LGGAAWFIIEQCHSVIYLGLLGGSGAAIWNTFDNTFNSTIQRPLIIVLAHSPQLLQFLQFVHLSQGDVNFGTFLLCDIG
jgi:hypothetical protein